MAVVVVVKSTVDGWRWMMKLGAALLANDVRYHAGTSTYIPISPRAVADRRRQGTSVLFNFNLQTACNQSFTKTCSTTPSGLFKCLRASVEKAILTP